MAASACDARMTHSPSSNSVHAAIAKRWLARNLGYDPESRPEADAA
jgi:hypothetical protein